MTLRRVCIKSCHYIRTFLSVYIKDFNLHSQYFGIVSLCQITVKQVLQKQWSFELMARNYYFLDNVIEVITPK